VKPVRLDKREPTELMVCRESQETEELKEPAE